MDLTVCYRSTSDQVVVHEFSMRCITCVVSEREREIKIDKGGKAQKKVISIYSMYQWSDCGGGGGCDAW